MTDRRIPVNPFPPPAEASIALVGDLAEKYVRFANAAVRLRSAGKAYEEAKSEYSTALAMFSASAEKTITGETETP